MPARLLNNAAIVHFMCNKAKDALDLLVEASQVRLCCAFKLNLVVYPVTFGWSFATVVFWTEE